MTSITRIVKNVAALIAVVVILQACTQMPTEKQTVVDLRPQISFKLIDPSKGSAAVYVDGLLMGQVNEFIEGVAAMRVLTGNHQVRVELNGNILLNDKHYLADGVSRTLIIQ